MDINGSDYFLVEAVEGDLWEEEDVVYLEEVPETDRDFVPYQFPSGTVAVDYDLPSSSEDEVPPVLDRQQTPEGIINVLTDEQLPAVAYEEVLYTGEVPQTSVSVTMPDLSKHTTYTERPRRYPRLTDLRSGRIMNLLPPTSADEFVLGEEEDGIDEVNPFRPLPISVTGTDYLTRLNCSQFRLDNRKYKNQKGLQKVAQELDSASCMHCNIKFFLPFSSMQSQISYMEAGSETSLPIPVFQCPLCGLHTTS